MKQYLLLLKSSDFNKSDNIWTTDPINLYNNSSYKNYSYTRSRYGLNLTGDNVYTGIELASPSYASPSYMAQHATPLDERALYVTDVGEVIYEEATPSLLRFIDTSSRIDVLAYKHVFTNVPGTEVPTFNIQIYESDTEEGPWLKSVLSFDSNIIFIKNSKPWIKIELEIFTENNNTSDLGLLFYLEVGIHELTSRVISTRTKSILNKFPTWTTIFEDSEEDATPSLATPNSVGGKFLTSILQDSIDKFVSQIDLHDINSYIPSADEQMLAWIYASYNVPVNLLSVIGDGIVLAAVHDLQDFYSLKTTDHAYFYNPIDKQILTIRKYENLEINNLAYDQFPINVFNDFDEFGLRVSLPRLYLESNEMYKKRILDVSKNSPGVYKDSVQRTLRRELDIWRAYGATPDSNYVGATPEIIEISDMESSTPYFTSSGRPLQKFKDIVLDLNERYPSNIGFVKWDEGIWDSAGMENEGISRIPSIYDVGQISNIEYYQPGVGDFSDARIIIEASEQSTVSFDGYAEISGVYKSTPENYYNPIKLDYSAYVNYDRIMPDEEAGKLVAGTPYYVGVGLTYEIQVKSHAEYATPETFYTTLTYLDRNDFYVYNKHTENHIASPEYNLIRIFDQEGFTVDSLEFKNKTNDEIYENLASPNSTSIGIEDISNVTIVFRNNGWDYVSQDYLTSLPQASHWAGFNISASPSVATPPYIAHPAAKQKISIASPNIDIENANVRIGSTVYASKNFNLNTDPVLSYEYINDKNQTLTDGLSTPIIDISEIIGNLFYPIDATPQYLYLNASQPLGLSYYNSSQAVNSVYGGSVVDFTNNAKYIVPSSPNILYSTYDSSWNQLTTPTYFESATINLQATPAYIKLESASGMYYPLYKEKYNSFTAQTTPNLFAGFIDVLDNVYETSEDYSTSYFNTDTFLQTIYLNSESFNLDQNYEYTIKDINFLSDTNDIEIYVEDKELLIAELNSAIPLSEERAAELHAKKDTFAAMQKQRAIHTGWLYLNQNEYYIYSNPVTDSATGSFYSVKLSETPMNGAPIIVDVTNSEYRNIVFEDEATPGKMVFFNKEYISANFSNSLYLAYQDVVGITVKDTYTGQVLFADLSASGNELSCFDQATPAVKDREYEVTYKVNNAWYLDNYVYDANTDQYYSEIYFSSTPNTSEIYNITYETSINDNTSTIDLDINPSVNPLDEGYIYVSTQDYNFSYIEKHLSPNYISDNSEDIMYLTVISYDINSNPKSGQTFYIDGPLIQTNTPYITTNNNGIAKAIIKYNGPSPSIAENSTINIAGIGSATPNGNENSQTAGYEEAVTFNIRRTEPRRIVVKAVPSDLNLNADGVSKISISGKILWDNTPIKHSIDLAWNKARTLKDLFENETNNIITSNSDGTFSIDNVLVTQDAATPGYWFARINIVDEEELINLLISDGESLSLNDVTIVGDIVYWHESYDSVQYDNEPDVPLPNIYTLNKQLNSQIVSTPSFVFRHTDQSLSYYLEATPNWQPPKWTPLNKYLQYQMGLFGSTPNLIADYTNIHPDYEE